RHRYLAVQVRQHRLGLWNLDDALRIDSLAQKERPQDQIYRADVDQPLVDATKYICDLSRPWTAFADLEIEVSAAIAAAHGEKCSANLVRICQECCLICAFQSVQNRFAFKSLKGGSKMFEQPAPIIAASITDQRAGLTREKSDEGTCAQPQEFPAQHRF